MAGANRGPAERKSAANAEGGSDGEERCSRGRRGYYRQGSRPSKARCNEEFLIGCRGNHDSDEIHTQDPLCVGDLRDLWRLVYEVRGELAFERAHGEQEKKKAKSLQLVKPRRAAKGA